MQLRARVVGVRLRDDGTFAVTLGPGPHIFWMRTAIAPRVGQMLEVEAADRTSIPLETGSLTVLAGGNLRLLPDAYARRVVSPQWMLRCQQVAKRRLLPHQIEGAGWLAERLHKRQGAILADSPGLGKTQQSLVAAVASRRLPAIIVCPASVKRQWIRELSSLKGNYRSCIVRGASGQIKSSHFVVINYDLLLPREAQLIMIGAKLIIFDECHNIKAPQPQPTHRAAVATRITKTIGPTILLSGSPILNRPDELWRLLHLADPVAWPDFGSYHNAYCTTDEKSRTSKSVVTSHGSVNRVDELRTLTDPLILRRVKQDVLTSLPPKQRRNVRVRLGEADQKRYAAVEKDVVAWLKSLGNHEGALSASRGIAVVKLNMLRRIAAVGKLGSLYSYLKTWFSGDPKTRKPLLVFAYHKEIIRGTHNICRALGLRYSGISGSDTDVQRQKAVDAFNSGWGDVFVAPIKSAGVGLNLQERCADVLFIERVWTPALLNQAEDRVHRLGQRKQVTVTYLDAVNTVDEHLSAVLNAKQTLIDSIIDDDSRGIDRKKLTVESIDDVLNRMRGLVIDDSPQTPSAVT